MTKSKLFIVALLLSLLCPQLVLGQMVYTNSPTVFVGLTANDGEGSGIDQMKFSFDNAEWTDPEPFAAEKQLELLGDDGVKCVYVQFGDKAGNWSESISTCINLDTTPPEGTIEIKEMELTLLHNLGGVTTTLLYRVIPQDIKGE